MADEPKIPPEGAPADPEGTDYRKLYEDMKKSFDMKQKELDEANTIIREMQPKTVTHDNLRGMLRNFVGIHDNEGDK